jgi:hypothetical protein
MSFWGRKGCTHQTRPLVSTNRKMMKNYSKSSFFGSCLKWTLLKFVGKKGMFIHLETYIRSSLPYSNSYFRCFHPLSTSPQSRFKQLGVRRNEQGRSGRAWLAEKGRQSAVDIARAPDALNRHLLLVCLMMMTQFMQPWSLIRHWPPPRRPWCSAPLNPNFNLSTLLGIPSWQHLANNWALR